MDVINAAARRTLKTCVAHSGLAWAAASKLPFSRFAPLIEPLFGGSARTIWHRAHLLVDPGELFGYYCYFLPDAPDAEYDFLVDACRGASVFFDVGANQGIYAVALATAHPQLQIVAFEPDTRLAQRILVNSALNDGVTGRVTVEAAAVTASSGTVSFIPATGRNSGVGRTCAASAEGQLQVPSISLADYISRTGVEPQVLKVDVEGGELDVLRGLGPFAKSLHAMVVELHPQNFKGMQHAQYREDALNVLAEIPLAWRFLIDDSRWVEHLDPGSPWDYRIHAFGTKRSM